MIGKNEDELRAAHATEFNLTHMTGKRQTLDQYIAEIVNGTLNYYSEATERVKITMLDTHHATVTGYSVVTAAVYGGGKHTWHLRMAFAAGKQPDGTWKFTKCDVSTY